MIIKIAFGFGSIGAVILIVFQGIKYITSLGVTQKLDAKNGLVRGLGALVILFTSFILFNQLNPELLRVRFQPLNAGGSVDGSFSNLLFGKEGDDKTILQLMKVGYKPVCNFIEF